MLAAGIREGHILPMCRGSFHDNGIRDDLLCVTGVSITNTGGLVISGYYLSDGMHSLCRSVPPGQGVDVWTTEGQL